MGRIRIDNILYKKLFLEVVGVVMFVCISSCNSTINKIGNGNIFSNVKNKKYSDSVREIFLDSAVYINKKIDNDSLRSDNYLDIAFGYYLLNDLERFKKYNVISKNLAEKNKLKKLIATSNSNLGYYYRIVFNNDSSYFHYNKALKYYSELKMSSKIGTMYYALAAIQSIEKDYIGSEINIIKALQFLKPNTDNLIRFLCYNNLAFIADKLQDSEKAIDYRLKGLELLDKENQKLYYLEALNGLALSYLEKGDNDKAINLFNEALLIEWVETEYALIYAKLNDNLGYTYFKKGNLEIAINYFNISHRIRDSLKNDGGLLMSYLHKGEYFAKIFDTTRAVSHLKKAKELAKENSSNIDLLKSLKLLALIDRENSSNYLNQYINLTEKLQQKERETREKFTRIAYETDEVIKEKEVLTRKNWWITIIGSLIIIPGGLGFFMFRQRAKNMELILNQEQDQSNIKIYKLMLNKQVVFQQGSNTERSRISKELHDGVLGKIFGARLTLDGLNDSIDKKDIEKREQQIIKLQNIEEEVRNISHNLKSDEFEYQTKYVKLVEELLEEQSKLGRFEYELSIDERISFGEISNETKINIYRIIQEALFNTIKYANASGIIVSFKLADETLLLKINDNGKGFKIKRNRNGIGLKNMKARSKDMDAKIKIFSIKDQGTTIEIKIPIITL